MGAQVRKEAVELVEVEPSATSPLDPASDPSRPPVARPVAWLMALTLVLVAAGGIAVLDHRTQQRRAAAAEHLLAAGTLLTDVGPGLSARWRVSARETEILAVADGVVVTATEAGGSQLVVGRSLATGGELWRSTFALQLGTSRCLAPERGGQAPVVVCALRAHARVLGVDGGGTALHVRDLRSGELLAERFSPDALMGLRLVDGDLLGAWFRSGELEVRREDAVTGRERWRLALETHEAVRSPSTVGVDDAGGELFVATERDVFAVTEDGSLAFSSSAAPPHQPQRLALRPVGEGFYAVWRTRSGLPADLIDSDGRVRLAAVGTPRELRADDGSLGTVVLTRHPDGDILWDVVRRTKLWVARGPVEAGVVVDGVVVLDTGTGLRTVDPRRGATLWQALDVTRLVGLSGDVIGFVPGIDGAGGEIVGFEPHSGREAWRAPTSLGADTRFNAVGGQLFALEPDAVTLLAVTPP